MTASLPMYWRAETAAAWQALWADIRDISGLGPATLDQPDDLHTHWRDPGLVLSQTCSLPLRLGLEASVQVLGSFDFGLPDTDPGMYHSVIVARDDLPAHPVVALNSFDSQSGWAALLDWRADLINTPHVVTGAHSESLRAVAEGRADIAALDAVTWDYLERFEPGLTGSVTVIARTSPTPGLPLITARPEHVAPLRAALHGAVSALDPVARNTLGLRAFVSGDAAPYMALPLPPIKQAPGKLP